MGIFFLALMLLVALAVTVGFWIFVLLGLVLLLRWLVMVPFRKKTGPQQSPEPVTTSLPASPSTPRRRRPVRFAFRHRQLAYRARNRWRR